MGKEGTKSHVLIFPMPAQGHINPMLQFAKRLASRGIPVCLVTTVFVTKSMEAHMGSIKVEAISDGFDDGYETAGSNDNYLETFKAVGSRNLFDLIQRLSASDCPVRCLVYDSLIPWGLDVARRCGLLAASFFTQSCAVDMIYYSVHKGRLEAAPPRGAESISLSGLPKLELSDLPSFVLFPDQMPGILEFLMTQFSNLEEADLVICNTFHELEPEELSLMRSYWKVKAIGPTVPSMFLDKRIAADTDYGLSLWKKEEAVCKQWLQNKEAGSVIYVSFGSLAKLSAEQTEEIAWALKESHYHFLWVVRASEESKLPDGFVEEITLARGLVVKWAPQLEVLAHEAIGCFVTHCGWNSVMEGISLRVPMVAVPQWSDQPTNAKYMEEVWGVGVRARPDEKGFVGREEIMRCVKEIMEGETRERVMVNNLKWGGLAVQAQLEGGSSDKDIAEFVTAIGL